MIWSLSSKVNVGVKQHIIDTRSKTRNLRDSKSETQTFSHTDEVLKLRVCSITFILINYFEKCLNFIIIYWV